MLLSDRMLAFLAQFFLKKISRKFCGIEKRHYLCNRNQQNVDSVAQLVEQMTLNHWVESSSLSGVTKQSLKSGCFFYFCRPQAVAYLQHASARTGLWKSVVGVSRNLVGINFRHPNVMPNFAVWKTITYRHWHRWCCQPRF